MLLDFRSPPCRPTHLELCSGTQSWVNREKSTELDDQFSRDGNIKCRAIVNEQHICVCIAVVQMSEG